MNARTLPFQSNDTLQAAIDDAYRVFARQPRPAFPLDVCLGCCMDSALEREMRELPLRRLGARHFYEYNTSAKSGEQPVTELLYFLPRMLELIAEGAEVHHSTELYLDRVGNCPADAFDPAQRRVLDRFALRLFEREVQAAPPAIDDPFSLLLMFDIGGWDVAPLLGAWTASESPVSTLQFVGGYYWNFSTTNDYENAFATDRPKLRALLREWLLDPATRGQFARKLLEQDFLELARRQPPWGSMPFNTMAGFVFDQLTQ
jgi:hypothetical protein